MNHFTYRTVEGREVLFGEDVNLEKLADSVGTPFYCYSRATLERHFRVFDEAFSSVPHLVCYSVKANSNLSVLNLFAEKGSGFDIVSGGELDRVIAAGGDPKKVVFAGVGKTRREMVQAIRAGVLLFNVESEGELLTLQEVAASLNQKARIAIRVNPDIDPKTHPYISTGLRKAKFGIEIDSARVLFAKAKTLSHLEVAGVDCHIGSQLTDLEPILEALKSLQRLIADLRADGHQIRYLDIGGGLGITYSEESPPDPGAYAKAILPLIKTMNVTLIMEPGRVIVGNAGLLVTRVLYTKSNPEKNFVIVDAAMNDLIRPALYEAHQEFVPVVKEERPQVTADVVGPICESGDFLALDRELPAFQPGDLAAVRSAGAYGFSMSSTYNTRPRVAEVMVDGKEARIIRDRETVSHLLRGERVLRSQTKNSAPGFRLPFIKMHGAGNDFIVVDHRLLQNLNIPWKKAARILCDRRFAIGADQILLIDPPPDGSTDIACTMTIFDADGSQVEMCGNGVRAVARFLEEQNGLLPSPLRIATVDRVVTVDSLGEGRYRVDMGEPILDGPKIPVRKEGRILEEALTIGDRSFTFTCVSMGNPHAVHFLNSPVADFPLSVYGPKAEHDPFFPNRVNAEFVEVLSPHEVKARVWERGTGETLACGSGACAILVAGVLTKRTERKLAVHLPGGRLDLEWRNEDNHVLMTGPAEAVFTGDVDLAALGVWDSTK